MPPHAYLVGGVRLSWWVMQLSHALIFHMPKPISHTSNNTASLSKWSSAYSIFFIKWGKHNTSLSLRQLMYIQIGEKFLILLCRPFFLSLIAFVLSRTLKRIMSSLMFLARKDWLTTSITWAAVFHLSWQYRKRCFQF